MYIDLGVILTSVLHQPRCYIDLCVILACIVSISVLYGPLCCIDLYIISTSLLYWPLCYINLCYIDLCVVGPCLSPEISQCFYWCLLTCQYGTVSANLYQCWGMEERGSQSIQKVEYGWLKSQNRNVGWDIFRLYFNIPFWGIPMKESLLLLCTYLSVVMEYSFCIPNKIFFSVILLNMILNIVYLLVYLQT